MIKGTKQDFILAIKEMSAIKGIKGINEQYAEWWIHPTNANIVHLIRIIDRTPFEPIYCFSVIKFNPNTHVGCNRSGNKQVKIGNKTYTLCRLVALTFVPNPNPIEKHYVWHKDKNTNNNSAANLVWVSKKDLINLKRQPIVLKLNIRKKN